MSSRFFFSARVVAPLWLCLGALLQSACAAPSEDGSATGGAGDGASASIGIDPGAPILSGSAGSSAGDDAEIAGVECMRVMSWGAIALDGAVPGAQGMDALVSWLNSETSASAEYYPSQPLISHELLQGVNVIVLQDLRDWSLSAADIEVVSSWVKQGGALMALSGYDGDGADALVSNELLSFSGMSFASIESLNTATSLGQCGYCLDTTHQQGGFVEGHPLAQGVSLVGAYAGRSIQGDGEIFAEEDGLVLGMSKRVEDGRVVLFHDEWITHASQWAYEPVVSCLDNPDCAEVSPQTTYQVPQFWYNALHWLAPSAGCFSVQGL